MNRMKQTQNNIFKKCLLFSYHLVCLSSPVPLLRTEKMQMRTAPISSLSWQMISASPTWVVMAVRLKRRISTFCLPKECASLNSIIRRGAAPPLLTGLYPHQAGVGRMTMDAGKPGYRGLASIRFEIRVPGDPPGFLFKSASARLS